MMMGIAHVGCGYWGKNLVRNFAELGALVAVVDGDPDVAAKMAAQYGVSAKTFAEVLADPSVTAISLATPAPTHADLALQAINAGKHVYVEKPLALDVGEAQSVVDAAQVANRVLMVGHLLQYHPVFLALKELVSSGKLGPINYVYSNRLSLGKLRIEENVLWSFAPHDISMVLALINEEPDVVTAEGSSFVTPGIADFAICHMRFPSGVRAHVQASWMHPFKEQRLVVICERGMAVFEDSQPDWSRRLALYPHRVTLDGEVPVPVKGEVEFIEVAQGEPLRNECAHFIDCITHNVAPRTDGNEGLRVLKSLQKAELALAASIEGKVE